MTTPKSTGNERGQMTIFIALIFQVLFVFFAMIINVGLIVHDKINLQNSVDLAAYYGAQRQAEVLNAIAHENYQIRQAWKLLSWRVRVLGDLGNSLHPLNQPVTSKFSENSAFANGRFPSICINNGFWSRNQNICTENYKNIPALPTIPLIAAFLPWNIFATQQSSDLQKIAGTDCAVTGPMDKFITETWLAAYHAQMVLAKQAIRTYAANLSNGKDIRGDSINTGMQQTLMNNLTRANSIAVNPNNDIHFTNSIGGTSYKLWLHEIPIYPIIFYTNYSGGGAENCNGGPVAEFNEPDDINDLQHSIFGVEKNPWVMIYTEVSAESKPSKPYLPFGDAISLSAKAFAKPFGGRIGPWFYSQWSPSALQSSGGTRLDPLAPTEADPSVSNFTRGAQLAPNVVEAQIPNYSRFPGDQLGLQSQAALASFKTALLGFKQSQGAVSIEDYSATPTGADGLAFSDPTKGGNKLQTPLQYAAPWIRNFEVAAIAPDLFDITYYSIDPNFFKDYIQGAASKFLTGEQIPYDIGNSLANGINNFDVQKQIGVAIPLVDQTAFWVVKDWKNLLTGWMPSDAYTYNFPDSFGKCSQPAESAPTPGACAQGGRVGYSVKIVSESYLKSSNLPLGGAAGSAGAIQNPPQ